MVSANYFTKWVEAEALANIRDVDMKKFVWKKIITRFRVPRALVSDNGLQFDSKIFREYCGSLNITNRYSSPAYPQSNKQVEATNKTIINGYKKRLVGAKGNWVEELLNFLWAYQTTPRRSKGETPFSMTYGTEAVIPIEVGLSSMRIADFTQSNNDEYMIGHLDALEKQREMVYVQLADYQQKLAQGYNKKVRPWEFMARDLVLRKGWEYERS